MQSYQFSLFHLSMFAVFFSSGFDQALAERWTQLVGCAARRLTRLFGGVLGYLDCIVVAMFAARKNISPLARDVPPKRASVFKGFP
jgi:hypothetical protein